jgi:hypothetical protein
LAERDGVPVAAIALSNGAVVVDPGDPAADAVRLLKLLRYRVMRQGGQGDGARSLLRRARTRKPATAVSDLGERRVRADAENAGR